MKKSYIYKELLIFLLSIISIGCFFYSAVYLLIAILDINNSLASASAIGLIFLTVSLIAFLSIKKIRKSNISKNIDILKSLKNKLFQPDKDLELHQWKKGKYIGFDDKNKTILVLNLYNKTTQIKATDFNSWAGYECRGNIVTFKFNDINTPSFSMAFRSEGESMKFCHKLDVLLSPKYKTALGPGDEFSHIVAERMQAA